jgi:hypothetical protein
MRLSNEARCNQVATFAQLCMVNESWKIGVDGPKILLLNAHRKMLPTIVKATEYALYEHSIRNSLSSRSF